MRNGTCKLCGGQDGETVLDVSGCPDTYLDYLGIDYRHRPRRYLRCHHCQMIFRDPMLNTEEKDLLYRHFRDTSLRNETHEAYFDRIARLPPAQSENHEKCQFLRPYLSPTGRLLDVGAGFGVFIHQFMKAFPDWQTLGIEPTSGVAETARHHGVHLVETYLTETTQETIGADFDLITVNHVLEHLDDPGGFLNTVRGYLSRGGLLYVEVPSAADIGVLDPAHDRFMCQHEVIFDPSALRRLLEANGLEIIELQSFESKRRRNNLRSLCRRADTLS